MSPVEKVVKVQRVGRGGAWPGGHFPPSVHTQGWPPAAGESIDSAGE